MHNKGESQGRKIVKRFEVRIRLEVDGIDDVVGFLYDTILEKASSAQFISVEVVGVDAEEVDEFDS